MRSSNASVSLPQAGDVRVRCLSIHADYQCRHSGDCCRAGWPIPLEDGQRRRLESLMHVTLRPVLDTSPCSFFEPDTHLCAIHRLFGRAHKPSSCCHFPQIALLDARGVSLTLSHYCPTAAALLFREDVPLEIVENPPSFSRDAGYEGLDARGVMPPLLRPGMLWDLDGYSAWEQEAVSLLAASDTTPESALASLQEIAEAIEGWSPSIGCLADHVHRAFRDHGWPPHNQAASHWGDNARVVIRYLAARLFASWIPYRADRLLAVVRDVAHAHATLLEESRGVDLRAAIRATDLRLVHARAKA